MEWKTNVAFRADPFPRELSWSAAVRELRVHNFKLRQARIEVTNSQEYVRQIFRDLAPTLNFRSGVSQSIKSLGSTGVDDITVSADSFLNIPGLVSFGARLYAARLMQARAEAVLALVEREQTIELYRLFLVASEQAESEKYLHAQQDLAALIAEADPGAGSVMRGEWEARVLAHEKEQEFLQQRISDLLNSRAAKWILNAKELPELKYHAESLPLDNTNRVAQLQMRLAAIELAAARAQLTGIRLRYWPELHLFISGPPLYQRALGRDRFWDASKLRASADLFWLIDTRGQISRQARQTGRQQELQRERLRQEALALIDQLLFTQKWLQSAREEVLRVDGELALHLARRPVQNALALQQYAATYQALSQERRRLKRELVELETLFWFVDEEVWTGQAAAQGGRDD